MSLRRALREALDRRRGHARSSALVPPQPLVDFVGGDYEAVGKEFLGYFVDLCGLQPDERLLDVGCGSGRMAVPLTGHLSAAGRYEGFDVSAEAVRWCTDRITPGHPNFRFQVADVQNATYNPKGRGSGAQYRFPYEDASFDFVFLTSVFTHLLPADVAGYTDEVARVLCPGGRVLVTFFLLNAESSALIAEGRATYSFEHDGPGYRTVNQGRPEDAVAYDEASVRDLVRRHGLGLREPIRYGTWCGRTSGMSFQDILILDKPG